MLVPYDNSFSISRKPWSLSLAHDVSTDVSVSTPFGLQRQKYWNSRGIQGLGLGCPSCAKSKGYVRGIFGLGLGGDVNSPTAGMPLIPGLVDFSQPLPGLPAPVLHNLIGVNPNAVYGTYQRLQTVNAQSQPVNTNNSVATTNNVAQTTTQVDTLPVYNTTNAANNNQVTNPVQPGSIVFVPASSADNVSTVNQNTATTSGSSGNSNTDVSTVQNAPATNTTNDVLANTLQWIYANPLVSAGIGLGVLYLFSKKK